MSAQLLQSPTACSLLTLCVSGVELEVLVALGSLQRPEGGKQVLVNQHTPVLPASPFSVSHLSPLPAANASTAQCIEGDSQGVRLSPASTQRYIGQGAGSPSQPSQASRLPELICDCLQEF